MGIDNREAYVPRQPRCISQFFPILPSGRGSVLARAVPTIKNTIKKKHTLIPKAQQSSAEQLQQRLLHFQTFCQFFFKDHKVSHTPGKEREWDTHTKKNLATPRLVKFERRTTGICYYQNWQHLRGDIGALTNRCALHGGLARKQI